MSFHPWILDGVGTVLLAVGASGLVALFMSDPMRTGMRRTVGAICVTMALGGGLLMVRAEALRDADRDLSESELAGLAKAVSQFPDLKFQVLTTNTDIESRSLALKVAAAIKAGTGVAPVVGEAPPSTQKGVVIVIRDRTADLGHAVSTVIGRELMKARVASMADDEPGLDSHTVRILVGAKP